MPSFLHQPSYEDFPLRLSQGLWQHSSRWEPTDFEYFARERQSYPQQIFARPKLYRHRRRKTPTLDAYWIYKDEETGPAKGWAELQSFPNKHFGKGFVFFALSGVADDIAQEALVALTSLIFTLSRNDHLHIMSADQSRTMIDKLSLYTGTIETLTSLPVHAWHPASGPMQTFPSLEVDRSSWRNCTDLQQTLRSMKHIEMRLERLDRLEKGKPKKRKKRPFLVRLFKPKVDDSLF
ncbi:MAG TPA: hypothetical protein VE954_05615 [Oligoflexus sp.]|uniref:hypothetical protein n=1 Tax=Oligoflexus sp. TaxID=1971216 RepID=UPI002D6641DE|nr:hypothetical protein [Oligoflexus sp.]HYX32571.1 hypothetical protein [Oligoflexus sp.]